MGRPIGERRWGRAVARRRLVWRGAGRALRYGFAGLLISVVVAQVLGLAADHRSTRVHHFPLLTVPEHPEFTDHLSFVMADASTAFGSRLRGWGFTQEFLSESQVQVLPRPLWIATGLADSWMISTPVLGWTPGGDAAWGRLFRTDGFRSQDDWAGHAGIDHARGFPALCLWHEIRIDDGGIATPGGWVVSGGGSSPADVLELHAVAWRPIWDGLVVNTIFYGLLLFGIVGFFRAARRDRRMRRGWCPACSYDLRLDFSGGCTECGWGRS